MIGSGPAGFYAAGHLLKDAAERIEVDMIERLPTPWGLVRSGVAPDHPKIKSVTRVYEKTAAHPRFRYFGNVTFGEHVSREELLEHYHAIVYATGSPSDRPLGIPGEELPGSHAATEFVGWYNGHPDHTDLEVDLLCAERAVVIGNGNVALDVARMLVLAPEELAPTDTADHALEVLADSRVSEVVVVGRRGPAQAAFTNPELLELGELADADVIVDAEELERGLAVEDAAAAGRHHLAAQRGDPALLRRARAGGASPSGSCCASCSRRSPSARARAGTWARSSSSATSSSPSDGGALRAQATDEHETIEAGLVFRAIGYRGIPLPGVPFDERSAVIPNDAGRVVEASGGQPLPGEYVVGWIKRGPSGVIGTNKKDAQETVDAMLADLASENGLHHTPPDPAPESRRRAAARDASPSSSPTPAGRRSTATSAASASPPGVHA